ncbi:MAG TPA: hypothetical protein VLZ06_10405 [Solirubrobacteraceae bacterium]|nr:hypothetical protein [Solirubrobacteraceae bacterium]
MAQTRRKRQTKHRGNAAGFVESRGRTGRKPTTAEKSGAAPSPKSREQPLDRRDRPPTWRGAFVRAMVAAIFMLVIVIVLLHQAERAAFTLFPIVLVMYIPISYYTDKWVYERRMRRKSAASDVRRGAGS